MFHASFRLTPHERSALAFGCGHGRFACCNLQARLLEEQERIRENGKPKIFISSALTEVDEDGNPYNFLVKEIENLLWEETKPDLNIEQKPIWGKAAKAPDRRLDLYHRDGKHADRP